jgi:Icc-related predicted phosphoesterase
MYQRHLDKWGSPDVLIISGDHVGHGFSKKPDSPDYYDELLDILDKHAEIIDEYFPISKIIITIGNNDDHYHDSAATAEDETTYYPYTYDLWFTEMRGNAGLRNS